MSLSFSTKAGTLHCLQDRLSMARIAPLAYFTVEEWRAAPEMCLARVASLPHAGPWIVRSSCRAEDNAEQSNAGAFLSLPDVASE
ncbi:MAG: hypothetical protein JO171_18305, partial [Paludibacterium sp.]